jgi:hypothetical protein
MCILVSFGREARKAFRHNYTKQDYLFCLRLLPPLMRNETLRGAAVYFQVVLSAGRVCTKLCLSGAPHHVLLLFTQGIIQLKVDSTLITRLPLSSTTKTHASYVMKLGK